MAQYKFLYLDDEADQTTQAIADGLGESGQVEVIVEEPKKFDDEIQRLQSELNNFDGIILDLRLDGKGNGILYNAPALAQELRLQAIYKKIKHCPIILCSTDERMKATYDVEKIYNEHFDYKFAKKQGAPWDKFALKLHTLAEGYQFIEQNKTSLSTLLGREDLTALDSRVLEIFNVDDRDKMPIHDYSFFVIKELFHHPGVLIKEKIVAARLGVDIENSPDWQTLLTEFFSSAAYTGVFHKGWKRWWADKVLTIFKQKGEGKRLSMLNAKQRVDILRKFSGLQSLTPALPMEYNKSTNFWTVCETYKKPLDPLEGFRIHTTVEAKSWQEHKYISLKAVLEKIGPQPHSSEKQRIELIKEEMKEQ